MGIVSTPLQLYVFVLLAYMVLSFVPQPPEPLLPVVRGVRSLVDPILEPIRRRLSPVQVGGFAFDLSLLIVFILCQILIVLFAGMGL